MTITALKLRERLQYDPITGRWIWLRSPRPGYAGRPAGSLDAKGYWCIKIDGQSYKASRLAYLYMTGEWPDDEMDHADGITWNDVWTNLRPATRTENNQNRRNGYEGVGVIRHHSKWKATVGRIYLGLFDTYEEAVAARDSAAKELHGEFAVLNQSETLQ